MANAEERTHNDQLITYSDSLAIIRPEGPVYPQYASKASRMDTFQSWKHDTLATKEKFVDAGWVYTGKGDHVFCFGCDTSLHSWNKDDDPMEEHRKHSPNCTHIRLCLERSHRDENMDSQPHSLSDQEEAVTMDFLSVKQPEDKETDFDPKEAAKENDRMRARMTCQLCLTDVRSVVYIPCGHLVACRQCALSHRVCPECRSEINGLVNAYWA